MSKQYRVKHTICGLKEDPQEPTTAGELVTLELKTAAELLAADAIEELEGDDLLAEAADAEAEAERLRLQAQAEKEKAADTDKKAAAKAEEPQG